MASLTVDNVALVSITGTDYCDIYAIIYRCHGLAAGLLQNVVNLFTVVLILHRIYASRTLDRDILEFTISFLQY